MFYQDGKLQYQVRCDNPSPLFARALQQAIGGVEGEIRVMMQYMFQAWGSRGAQKYRDMLLNTGTEEIAHIEMLATAVAMNLEGSPMNVKEEAAEKSPMVAAILGGMNMRHFLSTGMAATPENANGVPFNASHVYASGNLAADMLANVTAEATGRVLACRLYEMTDDAGMRDMLSFLIARDTMHQQQWLAVLEELGGMENILPIPNSFPQSEEVQNVSYAFVATGIDGARVPEGRFTKGQSLDGKGEFSVMQAAPLGQEPQLAPPMPQAYAQIEDLEAGRARAAMHKDQMDKTQMGAGSKSGGGIMENIKDTIMGD
ncbi:MAG: Mn-containing catalase [Acidobacteria bacterium]|nr:Mn-containing catalase [Acidobacteriota bacterium]